MSNLKYLSVEELHVAKRECESFISNLTSRLNGQTQRLQWIEKYIFEKTPVEMTIAQIESELGHKVIIK